METKNKLTRRRKEEWKIWEAKGTLSYANLSGKGWEVCLGWAWGTDQSPSLQEEGILWTALGTGERVPVFCPQALPGFSSAPLAKAPLDQRLASSAAPASA